MMERPPSPRVSRDAPLVSAPRRDRSLPLAALLPAFLTLSIGCTRHTVVDEGAVNARALARVQQKTADARRLAFVASIDAVVHDHDESRAFFDDDAARVPDEAWQREDRVARSVGLLPEGVSLSQVTPRVLGDNAGGLYLPRAHVVDARGRAGERARLFIVPDVLPWPARTTADVFGALTATDWASELFLVHELVHALQDQHFDLARILPPGLFSDDGDRAMARKALLESEANLVAQAVLLGVDLESTVKRKALVETLALGRSVDVLVATVLSPDVPRTYTRMLVEQYTRGLRYVDALLDEGGLAAVDEAYRTRLPDSTEQLLFPEKRLGARTDAPRALVRLPADALPHARLASNTLGALALLVLLEEHAPDVDATAAVDGWGGDRYDIFDAGERTLFVARTLWDSEEHAARAAKALEALVYAKHARDIEPRRSTTNGLDDGRAIFEVRADGRERETCAVVRDGVRVLWIEGASPDDVDALVDALLPFVREEARASSDAPALTPTAPPLIAPRAKDDDARVRARLDERLFASHHRLVLRLGVGALVAPPPSSFAPLTLALDRELRWGFRPGLEWAPPLFLTARLPWPDERLLVLAAGGLTHVGLGSFDRGPALDLRALVFVSVATFVDPRLAVVVQGGAESALSLATPIDAGLDLSTSLSLLGSPWRPLTLHAGVAARAGVDVDRPFHPGVRAPALVLGSAAWRGRAPIPVVEVELFDGLSLTLTSETVLDGATLRLRAQRTTAGVLFAL